MTDGASGNLQITTVVAYIMILFSFFLIGIVFVSINEPLLKMNEKNNSENNISSILQRWDSIGVNFSQMIVFKSLIIGFVLNPISQFLSMLGGLLLSLFLELLKLFYLLVFDFKRLKEKWKYKLIFFTPLKYLQDEYQENMIWLLKHKSEKLHWEWEIFNYYLYWGLSTNVLILFLLTYRIEFLLTFIILTFISLFRSRSMNALYNELGKRKNSEIF